MRHTVTESCRGDNIAFSCAASRSYVRRVSELVGVRISFTFSVGPGR